MLNNIILTKDKKLKVVDIDFGGLMLSCRQKEMGEFTESLSRKKYMMYSAPENLDKTVSY